MNGMMGAYDDLFWKIGRRWARCMKVIFRASVKGHVAKQKNLCPERIGSLSCLEPSLSFHKDFARLERRLIMEITTMNFQE